MADIEAASPTTTPRPVRVRAATATDAPHVIELLTAAFLISPVGDWLIPDLTTRQAVYRRYFRIHVEHALHHGRMDLTHGGHGVAVWFPWDSRTHAPADYDQRLADACGTWLHRFQLIDKVFTGHHPTNRHHYLAFVGVNPDRQGEGVGSALLAQHATTLDELGIPAYLEASTPRSRDLYLRHGYQVVATGPIDLPEGGPAIWPMWRIPNQPEAAPAPRQAGEDARYAA